MLRSLRMLRWFAGAGLALTVVGCSDGPERVQADLDPQAVTSPPEAHDSTTFPVAIAWSQPIQGSVRVAEGGLAATLSNHFAQPLEVGVAVQGSSNGQMSVRFLQSVVLEPGESQELSIPISAIPVQTTASATPTRLLALVLAEGEPLTIASADRYIVFEPGLDAAHASDTDELPPLAASMLSQAERYDVLVDMASRSFTRDELQSAVAGLTVPVESGRIHEPKQGFRSISTDLLSEVHVGGLVPLLIRPIPVPYATSMRVCATWSVQFSDANMGEDFLADGSYIDLGAWGRWWVQSPIPARFARLRLLNQTTRAVVSETTLDESGCANVAGDGGVTYIAQVSTLLSRGGSQYDVRNTWVGIDDRACERFTEDGAYLCMGNDSFEKNITFPRRAWEYPTVTIASDSARPAFRIAAVAGQTLALSDSGLKDRSYRVYANTGCWAPEYGFYWREACASNNAYFGNSVSADARDTTLEKFVIAHELGHQIEFWAGAANKDAELYFQDPGLPDACRCDHVVSANKVHCLQSRHTWSAAHTEGFAHFIAARTFNRGSDSDCTFAYYKELFLPASWGMPASTLPPPVRVDCSTPRRWVASYCAASADRSSEWDHLLFYRQLNAPGAGALSMEDLFAILRSTPSKLTWPSFRDAAAALWGTGSDKYGRVLSAAYACGIDR